MTTKILIVDDRIENLKVLESILSDLDVELVRATSGNEAITQALDNEFALILIDVQMPEMDGYETIDLMRQEEKNRFTPVIFISAIYSENHFLIKGIETGAVDFMTKPIIPEILRGKVKVFVEYYHQKKRIEQTMNELNERNKKLTLLNDKLTQSEAELKEVIFSKDVLFSIIGHDLRNPLHSLISFSDMILNDSENLNEEERKEGLLSINRISKNMYSLVENLLDWGRIQTSFLTHKPESIDVSRLIKEITALFSEQLSLKNINLSIDAEDGLKADADPNMLKTILRNLISNAVKFTGSDQSINFSVSRSERGVEICVEDTGVGMTQTQLENINNSVIMDISKGTQDEAGTGIGLLVSKEFLKAHKSKLEITSEPGKGTKMSFILPDA